MNVYAQVKIVRLGDGYRLYICLRGARFKEEMSSGLVYQMECVWYLLEKSATHISRRVFKIRPIKVYIGREMR